MKKNELTNKKIISALLIGISALAAMPTVNAYANEGEGEEPQEPAAVSENTEETSESSTQEAEEQAEDTSEAIESAQEEVSEVTDDILDNDNKVEVETVGSIASEGVETTVEKAEELSADANLENAEICIDNVKKDLQNADAANKVADEAAVEVLSDVAEAQNISDNIEQSVNEAAEKTQELQDKFNNAGNLEEAKKTADELEKVVNDTKADISAKVEYYNLVKDKYDEAVKVLEQAEKDIDKAYGEAGADTREALANLADAKEKVEQLESALEEAEGELVVEQQLMSNLSKAFENVDNALNWDNQGKLLGAYVANYYLPLVEGVENISSIKVGTRVRGFDKQDYNYYPVTYIDNNGNQVTRYFNYDRVDKQKNDNPYATLGSSKDIAAFEKSAEEIGADTYLKKLYAAELKGELSSGSTLQNNTKNGEYKVYAYVENGETKYIARAQLEGRKADTREIKTIDGVTYVDGNEIHEVIQNRNAMLKENNIIVNTKVEKDAILAYIENTKVNVEKFNAYSEELGEAKDAVDKARDEAISLSEAIDNLSRNRTNKILSAAEVLGVEDVATYLGIEVTEDDAEKLNNMSLNQAIKYLDKLLEETNEKIKAGEERVGDLENKLDEVKSALKELQAKAQNTAESTGNVGNTSDDDDSDSGASGAGSGSDNNILNVTQPASNAFNVAAVVPGGNDNTDDAGDAAGEAVSDGANNTRTPGRDGAVLGALRGLNRGGDGAGTDDLGNGTDTTNPSDADFTDDTDDADVYIIDDMQIPLADAPADAEKLIPESLNWWWLLIFAVFGKAGEKMYKRHKERIAIKVKKNN
ncbi:MAG: hypothetical protein J5802_11620 [Butyrivibrio sp.]|nr:hypothetical protein [Butyrivibrio sp.]